MALWSTKAFTVDIAITVAMHTTSDITTTAENTISVTANSTTTTWRS